MAISFVQAAVILCAVVLSAELQSVFVLECSEHEVCSAEKDVFVVAAHACHDHRQKLSSSL